MKTLFFNLILFVVGLLPTMMLQAQTRHVDRNIIKDVKQYVDLKDAGQDTLNFLELNYSGTYEMKPLKQFFADMEADGLPVRSCILSDHPAKYISLLCFLNTESEVKEICKNNSRTYWINILLAYDLHPDTRFEECRVVYDKLVKFGINKLYPLSKEMMELIGDIKIDFMNIHYGQINLYKEEIESR